MQAPSTRLARRLIYCSLAVFSMGIVTIASPSTADAAPLSCVDYSVCVNSCDAAPLNMCSTCPAGIGQQCEYMPTYDCDSNQYGYPAGWTGFIAYCAFQT